MDYTRERKGFGEGGRLPNSPPYAVMLNKLHDQNLVSLVQRIKHWGRELGFQQLGVSDTELSAHEAHLTNWLKRGHHGEMQYMARHGSKRSRPRELIPGTIRIISARLDYLPAVAIDSLEILQSQDIAYISRYALGRDYHKVMRGRLRRLAKRIEKFAGPFGYRVFADSAPVLEKAIAENAGLGWIGKHTNLLNRRSGSWFFLGEIYTDLPLPLDTRTDNHCGICDACLRVCPTGAILAPYRLDARRCISYHTIELRGAIPHEFRTAIGNRIFGCDDCQLICPWNRFARTTELRDFKIRHGLDRATLLELFGWSEENFLKKTEGSALRRVGYVGWLRNIAVALGNSRKSERVVQRLEQRLTHPSEIVREHVRWALDRHDHH